MSHDHGADCLSCAWEAAEAALAAWEDARDEDAKVPDTYALTVGGSSRYGAGYEAALYDVFSDSDDTLDSPFGEGPTPAAALQALTAALSAAAPTAETPE